MAQNAEANILITIKEKGKEAISGIADSFSTLVKGAAAVGAALAAVGVAIGKLALDASEFGEIENAFRRLAISQGANADQILKKMKEASEGVISQVDMLKMANEALLAGIPIDKLGKMTEIAKAAANSTGESITNMMGSITNGLARGSTMMLRHAGIVFDADKVYEDYAKSVNKTVAQLSDAEKKQLFLNEALSVGQQTIDKLGESQMSAADKWDKLKATIADFTLEVGTAAIPALDGLLDVVLDLFKELSELTSGQPGREFFLGVKLFVADAEHSLFSFMQSVENLASTLVAFGKAAGAAITMDFKNAGKIIKDNQKEIEKKNVEFAEQRETEIENIIEDFSSKRIEKEAKQADEIQEAATNRERIKQKEISDIQSEWGRKNVESDFDMWKERQQIKKNMEERALDERVRRRETLDRLEKEALEKMSKEHADKIATIATGVQTFVSTGLQGLASKSLGFLADKFLPGIGGAVGQVFDLLSQNTEQFKQTLSKLFGPEFIQNVLQNLTVLIEQLPSILTNIIKYLADNMPAITQRLVESIIANLPEIVSAMIKVFTEMLANPKFIGDLSAAIAKGFIAGIRDAAGDISEAIQKAFKDAASAFVPGGGGGGGGVVGSIKKAFGLYHGGLVPGYASGGLIDNQIIRATPGEFVVNKDSAGANIGLLNSINNSNGRGVNSAPAITIVVNGGLLGDRESARMLAIAIDQELYRLRQGNESRAFDRSLY